MSRLLFCARTFDPRHFVGFQNPVTGLLRKISNEAIQIVSSIVRGPDQTELLWFTALYLHYDRKFLYDHERHLLRDSNTSGI
jgi:hypothetical protein